MRTERDVFDGASRVVSDYTTSQCHLLGLIPSTDALMAATRPLTFVIDKDTEWVEARMSLHKICKDCWYQVDVVRFSIRSTIENESMASTPFGSAGGTQQLVAGVYTDLIKRKLGPRLEILAVDVTNKAPHTSPSGHVRTRSGCQGFPH